MNLRKSIISDLDRISMKADTIDTNVDKCLSLLLYRRDQQDNLQEVTFNRGDVEQMIRWLDDARMILKELT